MSRFAAFSVALFVALPGQARELVFPSTLPEPAEEVAAPKPKELHWRANQINRCPDGRGGMILQDAPCAPAATAAAAAALPAVEVVELAALPPRPPVVDAPMPAVATPVDYSRGLLVGAGKLGLLVLAGYLLLRMAGFMRDQIRRRRQPVALPDPGPMAR